MEDATQMTDETQMTDATQIDVPMTDSAQIDVPMENVTREAVDENGVQIQYRNPARNSSGTIDCEINHPAYGWIPFTASPDDPNPQGQLIYALAEADATPYEPPIAPEPDPVAILAAERARMKCTRLQGRLVLGEATCAAIDAIAVDPATPWAMRQTIENAIEWSRTSQAMTELGYLLGYTDSQMDDLFRLAMMVDV